MIPGTIIFNQEYTIKDVLTYTGNGSIVIQDEITLKPYTIYVNYNDTVPSGREKFFVFNTGKDRYIIPYKDIEMDVKKCFGVHRYKDLYDDGIRTVFDMCGIPRGTTLKVPSPEDCKPKRFINLGNKKVDEIEDWVVEFIEYYYCSQGSRSAIRPIGYNNDSTLFMAELDHGLVINRYKILRNSPYPLKEIYIDASSYFQNSSRWFNVNGMTLINQIYYLPKIEHYFFKEDENILSEFFRFSKTNPFRKWLYLYTLIDANWKLAIGCEDAYYKMLDGVKKKVAKEDPPEKKPVILTKQPNLNGDYIELDGAAIERIRIAVERNYNRQRVHAQNGWGAGTTHTRAGWYTDNANATYIRTYEED